MWLWEQPLFLPPPTVPTDMSDQRAMENFLWESNLWMEQYGILFNLMGVATGETVNGLIEFPTPFADEPTGNIRASYVLWDVPIAEMNDTSPPFATERPAIEVAHEFGDIPRLWSVAQRHAVNTTVWFLDQILSSDLNMPLTDPTAGYSSAAVDAVSATTITGEPGGTTNGWTDNGVLKGDEIYLAGDSRFRTIKSITAGTPDVIELTTKTDVPLGTAGLDYVIRRPMTDEKAWIRVFSEEPDFTVVTLEFK